MMIYSNVIGLCIFLIILGPSALFGSISYDIRLDINAYNIINNGDYQVIDGTEGSHFGRPGYPELPVIIRKYVVPGGANYTGIRIINATKERIPGTYNIIPVQDFINPESDMTFTEPLESVYSSNNPYPGNAAVLSHIGFFRGHQIAVVSVSPFEYVPSERALYSYSYIEFEFVYDDEDIKVPDVKRLDQSTIQALQGMVDNPNEIDYGSSRGRQRLASSVYDSIPCLIITNSGMLSTFQNYAWWKTRKGIRTEVLPISAINDPYYYGNPADTFPEALNRAIKRCIKDYHDNKFTDWVILGGDVDIIPPLYVESHGESIFTDQYYADLDGNWDADGDLIYGEMTSEGDSIDYISDIYIGRIPCSNGDEAQNVIDKLRVYETDTTSIDYQTEILYLSSNLFHNDDGLRLNQKLDELVPAAFDPPTYMHQQDSIAVLNAMASGKGIITFYGHAQGSFNFITLYSDGCPSCRQYLSHNYINTKNCHGQYPVFFDFTCHNARLDQESVVGREFLLSDSAGGVGFMGSTFHEWSFSFQDYHQLMFDKIFNEGEARLGKAMAEAKIDMEPYYPWQDSYSRYAYMSYVYLGDPQMEMWTGEPTIMHFDPSFWDDTVDIDIPFIVVKIVGSYFNPIKDVKVCLTKGEYGTYMIACTDTNGYAIFVDPAFASTGPAYIVASKKNCFTIEDTIYVGSGGGGGCPMLYAYNNGDYEFINSIMAKSEDSYYSSSNNLEGYPLYSVPLMDDNTLKLRIREDEREKSTIDMLGVNYVNYPINSRVAFTNKNEFKLLAEDSLLPSEAIGANGESILERIAAFDGNIYECNGPGYCVLTYRPKGLSKIMFGDIGGGIEPPPGGGKGAPKYAANYGETASCNKVVVSVMDGNGQWQIVDEQYSRISDVAVFSDLSGGYEKGEIKVKLEWMDEISIDCLPFYFFADGQIEQTPLNAINVSHNYFGNIESDVSTPNDREVTLMPGQYIDLEFGPIPYAEGYRTAVAFYSVGRYCKLSDDLAGTDGIIFGQNYPNPFNPATSFSFYLPANYQVNLTVYNVLGQKVTNLIDEMLPAGNHEIVWNGTDGNGRLVSSGIYFAKFTAGEFTKTRKMTVIK